MRTAGHMASRWRLVRFNWAVLSWQALQYSCFQDWQAKHGFKNSLAQLPLLVLTGLAMSTASPLTLWSCFLNGQTFSGVVMAIRTPVIQCTGNYRFHTRFAFFSSLSQLANSAKAVCGNRKSLFFSSADRCLTKCLATLQIWKTRGNRLPRSHASSTDTVQIQKVWAANVSMLHQQHQQLQPEAWVMKWKIKSVRSYLPR